MVNRLSASSFQNRHFMKDPGMCYFDHAAHVPMRCNESSGSYDKVECVVIDGGFIRGIWEIEG